MNLNKLNKKDIRLMIELIQDLDTQLNYEYSSCLSDAEYSLLSKLKRIRDVDNLTSLIATFIYLSSFAMLFFMLFKSLVFIYKNIFV